MNNIYNEDYIEKNILLKEEEINIKQRELDLLKDTLQVMKDIKKSQICFSRVLKELSKSHSIELRD